MLKASNKIMKAQRILVKTSDYPSNIKLNMIEITTPPNCPPKRRIPDAVPSPTGNVV